MIGSGYTKKQNDYSKPSDDEFALVGKPVEMSKLSFHQRKVYATVMDSIAEDSADMDLKGKMSLVGQMSDASTKNNEEVHYEFLSDKWVTERDNLAADIKQHEPKRSYGSCIKEANSVIDWPRPEIVK